MTIYCPHQSPRQLEKYVCEGLALPKNGFQFIQTSMGGDFSGKIHSRVALLAALLAKVASCPVRLSLTSEEDFLRSTPSVPMWITVKLGAMQDGTLVVKKVYFLADNGDHSASAGGIAVGFCRHGGQESAILTILWFCAIAGMVVVGSVDPNHGPTGYYGAAGWEDVTGLANHEAVK
ncbi:MAG: molybdopterin-dependent oxidoreductase [Anaerolineaceae bacterium]|nr:molybdopterin-dependent oxidoreductase [Anaerolineaceae bacterium]